MASIKTKQELEDYKQDIETAYQPCRVLTANHDTILKNNNGSSGRVAEKDWPWIEYWRAMTGVTETRLTCSSCGEVIFVGDVPKVMQNLYLSAGDSPDRHKACGGHLWVNSPKSGKYLGGRYIAPLCPGCNNKRGENIPILKGTRICKELGSHIKEGE